MRASATRCCASARAEPSRCRLRPGRDPTKRVETIVDEVGAGDGFAAGFAYGLLHGWRPELCAVLGNLVAARALRGTGDWETYPRSDEVAAELLHLGNDAARTRPG
jgi:sugar/nucleoside kinase (ribokinase family)